MADEAAVTIVVVNFNSARYVDQLLDSLEGVLEPRWQLLAVDNASTDGSPDRILARFPQAILKRNDENLGFAPAVNQGIVSALIGPKQPREGWTPAEVVLLLNPDTTFEPDFLARLLDLSDSRTLVVPKVLAGDGTLAGHAGRFDWRRGLQLDTHDGEPDNPADSEPREVETGSFSCMLIPAEAVREVGLLDERLAFYYEDTDFVVRVRRAGFRLMYQPKSIVYHAEGSSSGGRASPFAVYYGTRNRPFVVRKHTSRATFAFFTAYFLTTRALKCLDYARKGQRDLLKAVLRGVRDYYRGRMGFTYTPADLSR